MSEPRPQELAELMAWLGQVADRIAPLTDEEKQALEEYAARRKAEGRWQA